MPPEANSNSALALIFCADIDIPRTIRASHLSQMFLADEFESTSGWSGKLNLALRLAS
jgi:hypothetical protein